jgi:5-methylcytosine-specific restriction enzyme subunit McrC
MNIPIENLYYLLIYAWDVPKEAELIRAESEPSTRLSDLYARVLVNGMDYLLRRGLDRGYRPVREALTGPRGKLI